MKARAVRLYGKMDLRLEEFDLPPIKDDEILASVHTDSICMSSYKAYKQGTDHKRIPDDVADNPIIIGHEFSGELLEIGNKWTDKFKKGSKFSIQPAVNYPDGPVGLLSAPGYSYQYIGGDSTAVIIPKEVMENDCLLTYDGPGFFPASLSEPMSCIVGAYHASYHTRPGSYVHDMGIIEGGLCAILAGVGPMGLGAIDYALHSDRRPGILVVTDIDDARLKRAESIFPVKMAEKAGVRLIYLNTAKLDDPVADMLKLSEGKGYDDVFVYAPVKPVVEQGDALLGRDGCLNFFAGPTDPKFTATLNFYNVHYNATHICGTSGGNTADMREALKMMADGMLNPAVMVTHVGGLDSVIDTTKNLPNIPGGKKLIYNKLSMPLTAIDDFAEKGKSDPMFKKLAEICAENLGLWSLAAEEYLTANAPRH